MTGHVQDYCDRPWFWLRRFVHRPWVCDCGQGWVVRRKYMNRPFVYLWERWPAPSGSWGLESPEVDDS